jgi:CHAT domain-containing protein
LRQLERSESGAATDPLLAFADPDFGGSGAVPAQTIADIRFSPPRNFSTYYASGHAIAEALHSLPPLPGTRVEGEALESALGGRPGSLLLGAQASKAELMARNADGRLAKVRVLEFATHGLVAGEATWLTQPALALAAGPRPEDELLLASEASTLRLNADWVLLSACDTASPDAPEAQGLSGLSRAFFFAGARSLLVSHWRVRDDVASRLVPAILLAARNTPGLSRAGALREASLAILDDPSIHGAHPSAWAPFTLIGEAER